MTGAPDAKTGSASAAGAPRDGRRFANLEGGPPHGLKAFLRWRFTRRPAPWPRWVENGAAANLPESVPTDRFALTFVNHSTFLLRTCGLNVLTDPVWSMRIGPLPGVGPKRVHAPGVALEGLPRIDLVLVSHNHYDHLDLPTLRRLERRHAPHFVVGLGNRRLLARAGLTRVTELDWWESLSIGAARLTFVPAQHWSARGPFDRNRTLWGGFAVESDGRRLYFAGDTGYGGLFRAIGERLGAIDVGVLPIGACEPRWFMARNHLNAADAVRARASSAPRSRSPLTSAALRSAMRASMRP